MKNFTQFSQWLSEQPQMKVAEVINAAVQKGLAMNSIIMGLPSNYNNAFQSIFLYHYDDKGTIVDDTKPEAEAIANSVISNAKSQLLGYSKYFKDTKCGEVVGSTVEVKREYSDMDFGACKVVVNKDTGQPQSASLLTASDLTLNVTGITSMGETGNIQFRSTYTVGCGYSIILLGKAGMESFPNPHITQGSGVVLLTYMGQVIAYSNANLVKSGSKVAALKMPTGEMTMGTPDLSLYAAENFVMKDELGTAVALKNMNGNVKVDGGPSYTKLVDNAQLSYTITDGKDLISVLSNYFLNPDTAISMIP